MEKVALDTNVVIEIMRGSSKTNVWQRKNKRNLLRMNKS